MKKHNYRVYTALNVAEKPSVAKSVSSLLNGGPPQREETLSQYNPVFRFDYYVESKNVEYDMLFTSVRGHIMGYAFGPQNKIWSLNTARDLYQANIYHNLNPDSTVIKNNLINIARRYNINTLILWLDCDREGENIAFEVIEIIKTLNIRNLEILRASFSAITKRDVINAMNNLAPPNKNLSDAVEIRQKIDLIIGASFTRIQTLTLKDVYLQKNVNIQQSNNKSVISYGPCQFPTLNFIVERAEKIRKFVPEDFYYLELKLKKFDKEIGEKITTFNWERNRIFDKIICFTILEKTLENKNCKIISIEKKEKKKYRPFPLNTVEMTKLISRKLHINSKEAMDIAEKLYRDGLISYPRTETQRYKTTELSGLRKLVEDVQSSPIYGEYCNKLLTQNRYNNPKMGSGDDKAHPPIHPVRYAENDQLNAKEKKVYDLIMRHFLATLSPDAKGQETTIRVKMGEEYFKTKGLIIEDKGYLEIYTFDYWSNSYVPNCTEGEIVIPYSLNMEKGTTSAPNFLTEAELIGLMDKNGIGTDATIHEHIKHVQERGYAKQYGSIFKPTLLGTSLRFGYLGLGIEIYKPYLRAGMEREIKEVSEGLKQKDIIYTEMKRDMLNIYGYQKIFLFRNLEALGWLKEKDKLSLKSAFKSDYRTICENLNLIYKDFKIGKTDDLSYIKTGFCPISLKLIEKAGEGEWTSIKDSLNLIPGETVFPNDESEISNPTEKINTIFVVFVGGVTYSEIEGIRFLNRKYKQIYDRSDDDNKTRKQFIIITTQILNSKRLYDNLGKNFGSVYTMKKFYDDLQETPTKKK